MTFASLASTFAMSADTVPPPTFTKFANASFTPAAEKSTVATDVASAIAAPCAAVTASSTVMVRACVEVVPVA